MRRRLVLAIALVAAAAVTLFAVPLALVLQRGYRDEDLLRLQRDAVAATRQIDLGAQPGDPIELPRVAGRLAVYDRSGARVAGDGPPRGDATVRAALRSGHPEDDTVAGGPVVAVPLVVHERVSGVARLTRSHAAAARDTRAAWLLLAAGAAAIVVLAVLAATLIGRRLARPLERLAGDARRLGEGDFSVRAARAGVTEVDAVAAAIDATAARLDDLVRRERAFSADASHQLRTPLAALRLELEAIELAGDGSPEVAAALAQVDRLQSTIDTLLAVARDVPRGGAVCDLAELTATAEREWHGRLAADGRRLRVAVAARQPRAAIAPRVLREILDVLLANAHRHGAGTVTIAVRDLDGGLALDVGDEGHGLQGDVETAFDRRPAADGHGIGLALARSLAHAEGARLTVTRAAPEPRLTVLLRRAEGDAERRAGP